jgi:hypothetical protein
VSDDLKGISPTHIAARIVFALGVTALTAMAAYYVIFWLAGTPSSHRIVPAPERIRPSSD